MGSSPAIITRNLGKSYILSEKLEKYYSIRDSIMQSVAGPIRSIRRLFQGGASSAPEAFHALQGVNLEVGQGEILGIIGHNGAGKSTLLKILARVTAPSTGEVELWGRLGSLLEVGTGFHLELTGRENVYLNGAVLGMTRGEINRKFDEIMDFAGIERFVDTPVKRYSTGMYLRLAFAVAAHLETEILLVDEALAVGDAQFQKKCLGKMGNFAQQGRTVLFVSHNMTAIRSLCNRAVRLDAGKITHDGPADEVAAQYLRSFGAVESERSWPDPATAPGNSRVRLRRAAVKADGSRGEILTVRTGFTLEFEYWNFAPGAFLNPAVLITNEEGIPVLHTAPLREPAWHGRPFPVGLFRSVCRVPGNLLNDGAYRVALHIVENEGMIVHREEDALTVQVLDDPEARGAWHGAWPGVVRPELDWATELVDDRISAEPIL